MGAPALLSTASQSPGALWGRGRPPGHLLHATPLPVEASFHCQTRSTALSERPVSRPPDLAACLHVASAGTITLFPLPGIPPLTGAGALQLPPLTQDPRVQSNPSPTPGSRVCRSLLTQEGVCLTLQPDFHFLEVAYPYIARRLLTDEDPALRERLFQARA